MRRRDLEMVLPHARWSLLASFVSICVVLGACDDRANKKQQRLNSRCEVHLDDLAIGDLDPGDLTSPQNPNDVCELYMFNHDVDEEGAHESEMIEPGRWSIECTHFANDTEALEDDVYTDCHLEIESNVVNRYQDGLLLCRPSEGFCPERPVGRRTICSLDGDDSGASANVFEIDWRGEHDAFEATTGSILSVDAVPADPDRVAVTWSVTDEEQSLVGVSWLELDGGALAEVHTVNVCESCPTCDSQSLAPRQAFSARDVAVRDDGRVLLASPCGWRTLVEAGPDGSVVPIDVTTPDSGLEPQFVLSVISGDEGFLALWTDGLAVYLTELIEEADTIAPTRTTVIAETRETQSREQLDAICLCGFGDETCSRINCVALWSEVTTFDSTRADTRDGQRDILIDTFYDQTVFQSDSWTGNVLAEGFAAQVAVVFPIEFNLEEYIEGLIVHRHATHGLLARNWIVSVDLDESLLRVDIDLQMVEQSRQISRGGLTSDFTMTQLGPRTQLVGWWERERDGDYELGGAVAGVRLAWNELVATELQLEDFSPTFDGDVVEPPPPILLRGLVPSDSSQKQLVVVAPELRDGNCITRIGLFSLGPMQDLDVDEEWPPQVTFSLIGEWEQPTPGACRAGCRGAAEWTGDGYLVALPWGDGEGDGPNVFELRQDGDEELVVSRIEVDGASSMMGACNVDLSTGPTGESGLVMFGSGEELEEERMLGAITLERIFGGLWSAASPALVIDGEEGRVGYSSPRSAILVAETMTDTLRPQIWSTHPFDGWRQRDFAVGRLDETEAGLELSSIDYQHHPVIDSRVSTGSLAIVPCDSRAPTEGDNLCVLVALARQDLSEIRLQEGYDRIQQLTPNIETFIVPINDSAAEVQRFEIRPGEDWRGLPGDCVPSQVGSGAASVCSMSQLDPLQWSVGDVAGFALAPEILDPGTDTERVYWSASSLNLNWMLGTDRLPLAVSSLGLYPVSSSERFAAAWVAQYTSRDASTPSDGVLRSSVFFSLLEPDLVPFTSGLEVTHFDQPSDESESLDSDVNDVRLLMARHLSAAVAALDDHRFVIAWREQCQPDSGVDCHEDGATPEGDDRRIRLRSAPVICRVVPSEQD